MSNNKISNNVQQKKAVYDVNNLYLLTTKRKIRADFETIRYITEFFVGTKDDEVYNEFFSNASLPMLEGEELSEFNKPFILKVEPLSKHVEIPTMEKQDVFYFVLCYNALERCAVEYID